MPGPRISRGRDRRRVRPASSGFPRKAWLYVDGETCNMQSLLDPLAELLIFNIPHSITIMTDGCTNFPKFLVEGTKPNLKKINEFVERSLMLVTALSPVIGYDKASKIAHYTMDNDLTLR